uniref:Aspartyl aminopeptidase n=1 Tax=Meloidogyne enterolobii TaxID=390850 RepID=A0A6V7VKD4_MELEN|nr:unnamed protein product [Meloidogyne enterolobii]
MASVGKAVSKDVKQQIRTSALAFLSFLNKSVTPFHAVESCESILRSAGFVELFVNQRLKVQPKGKFYIKSEKRTSIFAFALGGALKHRSDCPPYGGYVWRSWFDRDLSIAGRAIHLDSDRGKFEFNSEQHLRPILAQVSSDNSTKDEKKVDKDQLINGISIVGDHHDILLKNLTGLEEEFISGARLDNLVGTYTSIMELVQSLGDEQAFSNDQNIHLVACFDNEEVGSVSAQGAASHFMEWLMRRIVASPDEPNAFECAIGRSYLVSADQAHACHPNYANKHEDCHKPTFNKGVVVKINANQRYATSAVTHSIFKIIAESAGIPIQVVAQSD